MDNNTSKLNIHVNFKNIEECHLFDSRIKNHPSVTAKSFIEKNITDIIYNNESGEILFRIKNGILEYATDNEIIVKNIKEL